MSLQPVSHDPRLHTQQHRPVRDAYGVDMKILDKTDLKDPEEKTNISFLMLLWLQKYFLHGELQTFNKGNSQVYTERNND